MPYSFSAALSGLRASSDSLGVAGNNIANANTTAFKGSSISFADVFTSSTGTRLNGSGTLLQIGGGVRTADTPTRFNQGSLTDSGSPTSAAIEGNGFFVVQDSGGARAYTRAGDFALNRDGFLITPAGQKVQGYGAAGGQIPLGAALGPIKIPLGESMQPAATTEATVRMNLDSTAPAGAEFHAPVRVFDSKGVERTLDLVFTKQADGSYTIGATLDGNAATVNSDGPLAFDSAGLPVTPTSLSVTPDQTQLGGGALPSVTINLRQTNPDGSAGAPNFTNFASPSAVAATQQNGYGAGTLSGLLFSGDGSGTLSATFTNGVTRPVGQLALATFNSQSGLKHQGGNLFGETPDSGQPSVGAPGSGGRGSVVGGALEQSNVDIATEFTNLIVAQRSFQANSRVITTINQTLQELMQTI